MRLLILHVDYFRSEITEKGRSPLVEPFAERATELREGLVVLASVEKSDEGREEEIGARAAAELVEVARRVGAQRLVLHSFAHLFAELAKPAAAVAALQATETALRAAGCEVTRTPFGWFNTLEIRAKGHPLSRVARTIS
jgi:Archaea-specific editing domain of threonyl-tRNA synthetase